MIIMINILGSFCKRGIDSSLATSCGHGTTWERGKGRAESWCSHTQWKVWLGRHPVCCRTQAAAFWGRCEGRWLGEKVLLLSAIWNGVSCGMGNNSRWNQVLVGWCPWSRIVGRCPWSRRAGSNGEVPGAGVGVFDVVLGVIYRLVLS